MPINTSKEVRSVIEVREREKDPRDIYDSETYPTIGPDELPPELNKSLAQHPELHLLLQGAAHYDSSIVLHCLTVDAFVRRLLHDLFLRYPLPAELQLKILQAAGWVKVHDLGKIFVHENPAEGRNIYYPVNQTRRSITKMGLHWSHSVMSAALFANWVKVHPTSASLPVEIWTKHIAAHHFNIRRYLKNPEQYAKLQSGFHAIIQYFFKLSDVTAAIGFPREHNGEQTPEKIKEILLSKWLTDALLKQHFPFADMAELEELRHYLLTSLFDTYRSIRHSLPGSAWLGRHRVILNNELDLDLTLGQFHHLYRVTTDQNQQDWWDLLDRMFRDGVFERLNEK